MAYMIFLPGQGTICGWTQIATPAPVADGEALAWGDAATLWDFLMYATRQGAPTITWHQALEQLWYQAGAPDGKVQYVELAGAGDCPNGLAAYGTLSQIEASYSGKVSQTIHRLLTWIHPSAGDTSAAFTLRQRPPT